MPQEDQYADYNPSDEVGAAVYKAQISRIFPNAALIRCLSHKGYTEHNRFLHQLSKQELVSLVPGGSRQSTRKAALRSFLSLYPDRSAFPNDVQEWLNKATRELVAHNPAQFNPDDPLAKNTVDAMNLGPSSPELSKLRKLTNLLPTSNFGRNLSTIEESDIDQIYTLFPQQTRKPSLRKFMTARKTYLEAHPEEVGRNAEPGASDPMGSPGTRYGSSAIFGHTSSDLSDLDSSPAASPSAYVEGSHEEPFDPDSKGQWVISQTKYATKISWSEKTASDPAFSDKLGEWAWQFSNVQLDPDQDEEIYHAASQALLLQSFTARNSPTILRPVGNTFQLGQEMVQDSRAVDGRDRLGFPPEKVMVWHDIPNDDGTLANACKKRLEEAFHNNVITIRNIGRGYASINPIQGPEILMSSDEIPKMILPLLREFPKHEEGAMQVPFRVARIEGPSR